jgi:hypothetical protein
MIKLQTSLLIAVVALELVIHCCHCQHYSNYYAVHIDGDPDVARQLAAKHGFLYIDQVWKNLTHSAAAVIGKNI